MSNRRNFERYGADMIFWMKLANSDEEFHHFQIENISAGGILIDTEQTYEAGQEALIEFELPQHTDLIEAKGVIRHVHEASEGRYQLGLQFTEVADLGTDKLMEYLEDIFK